MRSIDEDSLIDKRRASGYNAVQNILSHARDPSSEPYDAAKAHEYYLRNRKLKGRKTGIQQEPVSRRNKGLPTKPIVQKSSAQKAKERAAIKGRVVALQARLAKLKEVLAELVKQAKARSGIETKTKTKDAASTTAQKAAEDKSSKEYYEKNKAKIAAKAKKEAEANNVSDLEAQIKEIQQKIAEARAELAAAIKR